MTKFADILLCNLATLGPIGHLRLAPGTIGSLVALGTGYMIASLSLGALVAAILTISILGIFAAERYGQRTGKKDASEVIIDEVAGQWIPLVIIPLDITWYITAFLLFRFFDISKIGPVGHAEKLMGGIGVMADDLVAGILAALILWIGAIAMGYVL
jgi:phosphatidylglycerophosphatase A